MNAPTDPASGGLRELFPAPATEVSQENLPIIEVRGGELPSIVDAAEALLLDIEDALLYERAGILARIVLRRTSQRGRGLKKPAGSLSIIPVTRPWLIERLTALATWIKFNARGEAHEVDCPKEVAATLLARGAWPLPYLDGVIQCPTLRPDGTILSKPGYDSQTGLILDCGATVFPPVPEHPTADDVRRALGVFDPVLKDFPWVAPCDRSAILAAIFTAIVRQRLRTAPLFAMRAPKMASGKSLLADVVAMIATGRPAPAMSQGKDEDEERKRLTSILMEGDPVCCIDNVERPLGSAALCSVLTQETFKDRILGVSKTVMLSTKTVWLATGNNLVFAGDLVSRVVPCDLDPGIERPEERTFDINLYAYVPEHRGELVSACLTILRAYEVAGRPPQGLRTFGRFEEWSDLVRSALVWTGLPDPCEGCGRLRESDPVSRDLQALLITWHAAYGSSWTTVGQVLSPFEKDATAPVGTPQESEARERLRSALVQVAGNAGGRIDSRRLGNWLEKHHNRLEGGLRIERGDRRQGVRLWRVDQVAAQNQDDVDSTLAMLLGQQNPINSLGRGGFGLGGSQ